MARTVAREHAGGLSRQALFTHGLPRNITATTNPGVNDDINGGYNVGSIWVNISADRIYFCADATDGAAVWALTASATLTELTALAKTDGNFIVGNGSAWVAETGATLRTSIGVGTGNSPQFTGIELGHASDTTIVRSGSGDITIEGNAVYRAGGTDVAVADGGTGQSNLNNLITLTTHTTGNYVATVTGGTGIDSTGATSGEGIAHSLSLDLSELTDTAIANGDYIVFTDTTDSNATVKGDLADVATLFAGTGLTASSSVIGVDASQTQITAVGALDAGSITSGFTSIDVGSGAITTTGAISGGAATLSSASASEPILNITNTHAGATSGILRFNKDSASGDDNDVMGTIEFYGTDAAENTHERLAYVDSYIVDSAHGSEAAGLRFYVAENDATLTQGLAIVGQPDDNAEVDVTIGAGAASTTTIAGTLTMGSTAAMTNTGLVAVADQSNITGVSTLSSGAVSSGFGNIDIGSSNLTATGTVSLGATSFNDNNLTNVGSVALDTITSDGTNIGFGTDGSGEDVYFYSGTAGDHMFWDSSEEKLVITGTDSQNALEVADGNVAITDNLTVSGDFTVSGTTTTVDTTNLTVTDPLIKLAHGTVASPANDLGLIFTRGNGSSTNIANRAILWDESADEFAFANTNDEDGTTTGNVDLDDYANIRAGTIAADDAVTVGGNAVYSVGGTDVAVADGGTGASTLNNLITMGTHTTGNYVATITAGTGLTSDGATSGESVTHSLSVDASQGQITTVGALNAGSITSGFTSIDVGSGAITTTGTVSGGAATLASSSANEPVLTLTNTHADATSGIMKFIKDPGSGQGADSDTIGTITFHGTDAGNNAPEELARMEAYVIEADHGSEAGGIKFSVAENDATMTAGLQILGVKDADGEIDVTIGAGAASTTIIAGTLTMGSTAAMTNAGLLSVANQSNITGLGTISSGTWAATDVAVAHGGTGASTLTANGVLIGNGTSAVTAVDMSTKGGILAGDGSGNPSVLAVGGSNGHVLMVDSGEATGLKYAAVPAGTAGGLEATSASANEPLLTVTNTHADATAGILKFIKDPGSGQGADSDIMGTITFFGTDAGNNAPEELARMEAYVIEADHGSEAGGIKFYVAENDATMTAGLQILGVKDADGEIDVTIGAGAASTTIIAGTLTMGSTAAMTNAGIVSVGAQTGITNLANVVEVGALNAGSITSDFGAIDNGTSGIRTNTFTAETSIVPDAVGGADIGSTSAEWGDVYIADDKKIQFGDGQDATIEYDEDGTDQLRIAGTGVVIENDVEIADSKFIEFASAAGTPTTNDKAQGIVIEFLAVEAITQWDAVYVSTTTGRVGKADANDADKMPVIGVAIEAQGSAGSSVRILTHGVYRDDEGFSGNMTVGVDLYAPETPGNLTTTRPSDDGDLIQVIGVAIGARSAFINPSLDIIEHA